MHFTVFFIYMLKFYPTLDSLSHLFYPFLLLFFLLYCVWEGAHQKCVIFWRCRHTMALYNGRILFSNLIPVTSNIFLAFLSISEQQDDILRECLILRSLSKVVLPDLEPFLKPIFWWKTFFRDCLTNHKCKWSLDQHLCRGCSVAKNSSVSREMPLLRLILLPAFVRAHFLSFSLCLRHSSHITPYTFANTKSELGKTTNSELQSHFP